MGGHVCVCRCVIPCLHVQRPEVNCSVFLYCSLPYFWDRVSHWTCSSPFWLDYLASKPLGSSCLHLTGSGIIGGVAVSGLLTWVLEVKLRSSRLYTSIHWAVSLAQTWEKRLCQRKKTGEPESPESEEAELESTEWHVYTQSQAPAGPCITHMGRTEHSLEFRLKEQDWGQAWWCIPLIPTLRRQSQGQSTQWDPVSNNNNNNSKQNKYKENGTENLNVCSPQDQRG